MSATLDPQWRLGLDPGKETGWAAFRDEDMFDSGAISGGFDGFIEWWENGRAFLPPGIKIVMERFVPLEGFRGVDQTYSLEIQGAARALARAEGVSVTLQLRSDKATLFGQQESGDKGAIERREWLRERGLAFDTDHAMDAGTHVLVNQKRNPLFWARYWAGR
jgi:hypothetical protein